MCTANHRLLMAPHRLADCTLQLSHTKAYLGIERANGSARFISFSRTLSNGTYRDEK